ncbi:MAG: hypothetical protein AAFY65_04685 [Pseudomonadota bacterium]
MADEAALNETIARLEAALGAATRALDGAASAPDLSAELASAQAALAETEAKVAALQTDIDAKTAALAEAQAQAEAMVADHAAAQAQVNERPAPEDTGGLRARLDEMSAAMDALRAQAPGAADQALVAEMSALRAARALDLAEMQDLLAELEPMLEAANA